MLAEAHATTNEGYSPASPLPAFVGWRLRFTRQLNIKFILYFFADSKSLFAIIRDGRIDIVRHRVERTRLHFKNKSLSVWIWIVPFIEAKLDRRINPVLSQVRQEVWPS